VWCEKYEKYGEKRAICGLSPLVTENSKVHDFEVVVSVRKVRLSLDKHEDLVSEFGLTAPYY